MRSRILITALALGALTGAAFAQPTTQTFNGTFSSPTIPDNSVTGTSSTININIPDNVSNGINSKVWIDAAHDGTPYNFMVTLSSLTHTWVGDLVVTLTSPAGTTVEIIDRLSRTTGSGGGDATGDSSNLSGSYSFSYLSTNSFLTAAESVGAGTNVANGIYATAPNATAGSSVAFGGNFFAFDNQNLEGNWTLNVSDRSGGDFGSIVGWSMQVTFAPEPGTFALMGLGAGLGILGLRRRKSA